MGMRDGLGREKSLGKREVHYGKYIGICNNRKMNK